MIIYSTEQQQLYSVVSVKLTYRIYHHNASPADTPKQTDRERGRESSE